MEIPSREKRSSRDAKAVEPSVCPGTPASRRPSAGVTKQEDKFPAGPEKPVFPPAPTPIPTPRFSSEIQGWEMLRKADVGKGELAARESHKAVQAEVADDCRCANLRGL